MTRLLLVRHLEMDYLVLAFFVFRQSYACGIRLFFCGFEHFLNYPMNQLLCPALLRKENWDIEMNYVHFCQANKWTYFSLFPGCGCGRTGRKTQNHHWLPDPHNPSAACVRRKGRTSDRRIHLFDTSHGRLCHSEEKPRLCGINETNTVCVRKSFKEEIYRGRGESRISDMWYNGLKTQIKVIGDDGLMLVNRGS